MKVIRRYYEKSTLFKSIFIPFQLFKSSYCKLVKSKKQLKN